MYEIVEGLFGSTTYHVDQNAKLIISRKSMDAATASNSHKEAEERRRKRINGHIATLKSILPNAIKTDKASLLGEAVRRVRELKKTTAELSAMDRTNDGPSNTTMFTSMFPSETDELNVSPCEENLVSGLIKATMCCDDRPDLVPDLIRALESAEAKVVRSEMSTVGGRTKSVLWVRLGVGEISNNDSDVRSLERLRSALKLVVDKSTLFACSGPRNKRARWYQSY